MTMTYKTHNPIPREAELDYWKRIIDSMSRREIAIKLRFSEPGTFVFDSTDPATDAAYDYLLERFQNLGGWTPELSKDIGW